MHSSMLQNPQDITIRMLGNPKLRLYFFNELNQNRVNISEFALISEDSRKTNGFKYTNTNFVIPVGYMQDYDVFIFWDASKNNNWNSKKTLCVKTSDVLEAFLLSKQSSPYIVFYEMESIIITKAKYLDKALSKKIDLIFEDLVK